MMDELTRLAVAARDGEPHDMAAFIRASQRQVWWLCAHLVDEDSADDLTQETYLRVFGNLLIGLSYMRRPRSAGVRSARSDPGLRGPVRT